MWTCSPWANIAKRARVLVFSPHINVPILPISVVTGRKSEAIAGTPGKRFGPSRHELPVAVNQFAGPIEQELRTPHSPHAVIALLSNADRQKHLVAPSDVGKFP